MSHWSAEFTPTQSSFSPASRYASSAVSTAVGIGAFAGIGYTAGSVFSIINPVGGAIFGATFGLTSAVTNKIMNAVGCSRDHIASKIAKFVISGVLSTVAATFTVAAVGFPITFTAAAILVGGMVLVNLAIQSLFKCVCCIPLIGAGVGAAIAITHTGRSEATDVQAPGVPDSRDVSTGRTSPLMV